MKIIKIKKGSFDTIILKYNDKYFEVDFFVNDKNSIGVYTINISYLDKR